MVEGINLEEITFRNFESEADLKMVMEMITEALSEPYPIYTYRYFLQKWPELGILAYHKGKCIGCVVSKLENNKKYGEADKMRGYIAMLSVNTEYRRCGLGKQRLISGKKLVRETIQRMKDKQADEVMLETEITNAAALRLYESKYT